MQIQEIITNDKKIAIVLLSEIHTGFRALSLCDSVTRDRDNRRILKMIAHLLEDLDCKLDPRLDS